MYSFTTLTEVDYANIQTESFTGRTKQSTSLIKFPFNSPLRTTIVKLSPLHIINTINKIVVVPQNQIA